MDPRGHLRCQLRREGRHGPRVTSISVPLGEGIHRITLALPLVSPTSVNCYVVEGDHGLTLIDCGVNVRTQLDNLVAGLRAISGGDVALERLICTHLHFDHMGGARTLLSDHPAEFAMHRSVGEMVEWYNDPTRQREELVGLARDHGAPSSELAIIEAVWTQRPYRGSAIPPSRPVDDGDRIEIGSDRYLEVIHTPGHDRTHLCLRDSRTGSLFSGDHILPRITPFVPYDADRDGLAEYLAGLERIEDLDPGVTLPGHGEIVERGGARGRQIALHHERRLGAIAQVVRGRPGTAWYVMTEVFRPDLSPVERILALQETLSHVEHLVNIGRLRRSLEEGVWRYGR